MRKITFDEEEMFALAVLESADRKSMAAKMADILPELKEDPEMHSLILSAMEKLKKISDRDYEKLGLDAYREELRYMDEEDDDSSDLPAAPGGTVSEEKKETEAQNGQGD